MLTDGASTGSYWQADGIAELLEPTGLVKVAQNGVGDAVACEDIVATASRCDGTFFLVADKVVPQVVKRDGILLGIHVMGRNPGEAVKAPVHEVAHICPPIVCMH